MLSPSPSDMEMMSHPSLTFVCANLLGIRNPPACQGCFLINLSRSLTLHASLCSIVPILLEYQYSLISISYNLKRSVERAANDLSITCIFKFRIFIVLGEAMPSESVTHSSRL